MLLPLRHFISFVALSAPPPSGPYWTNHIHLIALALRQQRHARELREPDSTDESPSSIPHVDPLQELHRLARHPPRLFQFLYLKDLLMLCEELLREESDQTGFHLALYALEALQAAHRLPYPVSRQVILTIQARGREVFQTH